MTLKNQEFTLNDATVANKNGISPLVQSNLMNNTQNTFITLMHDTIKTAKKLLWGLGKFLMSTSESISFMWDVALNSVLGLLKTGGEAFNTVVTKIKEIPVLSFGADGINEVVKTSLDVIESNTKHDIETRKMAFTTLSQKLSQSGGQFLPEKMSNPTNDDDVLFFPSS